MVCVLSCPYKWGPGPGTFENVPQEALGEGGGSQLSQCQQPGSQVITSPPSRCDADSRGHPPQRGSRAAVPPEGAWAMRCPVP